MRLRHAIPLAAALLGPAGPAPAQDFVGFDRSSFGRVVLNRTQAAGAGDVQLELSVGSYNNEEITNYSADSVFARIGLSVGRLDILTDNGVFPCTAFIVDDKHVLTNYHCVPGILDNEKARATRIDAVQFVAGYREQGVTEGTRTFTVSPTPVEAHQDLDYALLEVIGNPSADFGRLKLSDREPKDGDPYWVIGHPMGEAQRISREQCRANRPALSDHRLLHTCDTLPGNSGSPVIDASLQMVVGLHHAGSQRDAVNYAIPMREIIARSQILVAAVGPVEGSTSSGTATDAGAVDSTGPACDTLWKETRSFGQCFAYRAYLEQCETHAYAGLARGFVADQCQTAAVPNPVEPVPAPVTPAPVQPKPEAPAAQLLRPWCGASGLNATEATICGSAYLAGLDTELDRAYAAQSGKSTTAQQREWLTGTRNACGASTACIGQAIIDRIAYLNSPVAPSRPETGTGGVVAGNYTLSDAECYVTVASRASIAEAQQFIADWFPGRAGVRMFRSNNGWYAVTVATVRRDEADARLARFKAQGAVPGDSYCSSGRNFTGEVLWQAGGGGVAQPQGCTAQVVRIAPRAQGGNSSFLAVRQQPTTRAAKISELYLGDRIAVLDRRDGWALVRCLSGGCEYPNAGQAGVTGWSSQKYLSISCN